jgi:hypothetical protein
VLFVEVASGGVKGAEGSRFQGGAAVEAFCPSKSSEHDVCRTLM